MTKTTAACPAFCLLLLFALSAVSPAMAKDQPAPRFESCSRTLAQTDKGNGCLDIEVGNACKAPRIIVLCTQSGGAQSCQTSPGPVEPGRSNVFEVCPGGLFTTRHAACAAADGCDAFAARAGTGRAGGPQGG